ncbi:DUF1871 family protein [Bacillus altitudinis]|uniref:DUF1871 family protein n=1 Tax=Bacillus altitudinis TaxID=293387 RepID=UPI0005A2169B|nr:DUF1871 family protein [Bacillus altitudinis]MDN0040696.1 DUF1871 family protein [Bacillus aerophilus]MCM3061137.1 YugE family protein [Bacillus altitudinis]MCM3073841.1 YugE family protein [Bacillus altitudinis]PJI14275.1 DUF1871 domain-containing protein [Bacillus altitudinis]PKQ84831.1 DUF1871 domain-containing protein [Bacillus altitudinis]
MKDSQAVEEMIQIIKAWDPFQYGEEFYETEPADVISALYDAEDPLSFAKDIQAIYHHSFDQLLPMESCQHIANQLFIIREGSSCSF